MREPFDDTQRFHAAEILRAALAGVQAKEQGTTQVP